MAVNGSFSADKINVMKSLLRTEILRRRTELPKAYCQSADETILERFLEMPIYQRARVLFTYVSLEAETDTRKLIHYALKDEKVVTVPKCTGKGVMKAYRIWEFEDLKPGAYGILEPKTECEEIDPKALELAVIPCVTCNEKGGRLGYGGGYYDRYLPTSPAVRILLCRERMMSVDIPEEPHDCKADIVVTEERICYSSDGGESDMNFVPQACL